MGEGREKSREGILYLVATPIGNLEDITLRSLRILQEVDVIACEDTRVTIKLLNKYGIKKKLISYYQPRERTRISLILDLLKQGQKVALVSDAGTPGVSDPGYLLVRAAIEEKISIIPLPGPSALTASLSASGLPVHRVLFLGFPPPKKEKLRKLLLSLKEEKGTIVFYLPARKLTDFLSLALETLGNRRMVIAREITKIHEEFIRGQIEEVFAQVKNRKVKGELTILIEGS